MTIEKQEEFISRINKVSSEDKAKYGKMNVSQMICHCADQFRIMFGEIEGLKRQSVDLAKFREMAMRNETLPTPDGLDQANGDGTKPTLFEDDKKTLIMYLNKFIGCDDSYSFSFHPYFPGEMDRSKWDRLVIQHLDHHLSQFGR